METLDSERINTEKIMIMYSTTIYLGEIINQYQAFFHNKILRHQHVAASTNLETE